MPKNEISQLQARVISVLRRVGHPSHDRPEGVPALSNSLALIEAVVALEHEFGVRFALSEIHQTDFFDVNKLSELIGKKLSQVAEKI